MTNFHDPSATGLTMGTPDAAKPHLGKQVRSLVPVEREQPMDSSSTTTNKATVPHRGRGFNRNASGVL